MCPVCFSRRRGRVAFMKLTWLKKMISNWSRTRFCVAALVESSSTVPTTAVQILVHSSYWGIVVVNHVCTFRCAAEQNVNPAKYFHRFCNSSPTLSHHSSITSYPSYPILPPFSIFPPALALVNQFSELGASFLVFDFLGWQAGCDVISMREQESD